MRQHLKLIRHLCAIVPLGLLLSLLLCVATAPRAACADPDGDDDPDLVMVQGYVVDLFSAVRSYQVPIPGALISYIFNNTSISTVSGPTGFYSIVLPAETYLVVVSAPGYQTDIAPTDIFDTQTRNIALAKIPFNGFVPYAPRPVLETSPGQDTTCTIIVDNEQVIDQTVTFTVVTPPEWIAWFPEGEALIVHGGYSEQLSFQLRYEGTVRGPHTIKVVANGGAYSAEIPVVVIVKDLPYETLDFYSNAYSKEVMPGTTAWYLLTAVNNFHTEIRFRTDIWTKCDWPATTESEEIITKTDNLYTLYKGQTYKFWLRVYVPEKAIPGDYEVRLRMSGEGVQSKILYLRLKVNNSDKLKSYFVDEDGTPLDRWLKITPSGDTPATNRTNLSGSPNQNRFVYNGTGFVNDTVVFRMKVTNLWQFPALVQPRAWVINDTISRWTFHFYTANSGMDQSFTIPPMSSMMVNFTGAIPDVPPDNYTVKIVFFSMDQETNEQVCSCVNYTAISVLRDPPPPPPAAFSEKTIQTGALIFLGLCLLTSLILPIVRRLLFR